MRSVVKHSYIRGAGRIARASAHINYIQYRAGEDREEARQFFSTNRADIMGLEVKKELRETNPQFVHKLILSPGLQGIDMRAYTRCIMTQLEKEKGLDLKWAATVHKNTDHDHAHVVLFGKDASGRTVQLSRDDHDKMREFGDRYLERHHTFERFISNELPKLLNGQGYSREGDDIYRSLLDDLQRARIDRAERKSEEDPAQKRDKKKDDRTSAEDDRIHRQLDKDLTKSLKQLYGDGRSELFGKGREQRIREKLGRSSNEHGNYLVRQEISKIHNQLRGNPGLEEQLQPKLDGLKSQIFVDNRNTRVPNDVDDLLGPGYAIDNKRMHDMLRPWSAQEQKLAPFQAIEANQSIESRKVIEMNFNKPDSRLDSLLGESRFAQQQIRTQIHITRGGGALDSPKPAVPQIDRTSILHMPKRGDDGEQLFARGYR